MKRYLHLAAIHAHTMVQEGSEGFEPLLADGRSFPTFDVAVLVGGRRGHEVVKIVKSFVFETSKRRGQAFFQIQQKGRQHDSVRGLSLTCDLVRAARWCAAFAAPPAALLGQHDAQRCRLHPSGPRKNSGSARSVCCTRVLYRLNSVRETHTQDCWECSLSGNTSR